MTMTSLPSSSIISFYFKSPQRSGITAFVVICVAFFITLIVCNCIGVLTKYSKTHSNSKGKSNENTNKEILVNNFEIIPVTKEFIAMHIKGKSYQINNINNNNKSKIQTDNQKQEYYQISFTDENSYANEVALRDDNNSNLLMIRKHPRTQHNRLVDDINIGNQHFEFNKRLAIQMAIKSTTITPTDYVQPKATNTIDVTSNIRESVEMKYEYIVKQQREEQQTAKLKKPQSNNELVLHRRKRYLIFPEGSSFQLVFDLIIGIIDYTSYAILGITCAVAWELPSKPPSELIENLHDKITEGLYTMGETKPTAVPAMRRNDSDVDIKYSIDDMGIKYVDNENMGTRTNINYENILLKQAMAVPTPPTPSNTLNGAYYTNERQPKPFASHISSYNEYKKMTPGTRYYTNDEAYQPTNYYANAHYKQNKKYNSSPYKYNFSNKNEHSSYNDVSGKSSDSNSNNNNNNNNISPYSYSAYGDSKDKEQTKFTNWWQKQKQQHQQRHQQPQYKKWQSWQDYDSNWQPYKEQKNIYAKWEQEKEQKWATKSKYVKTDNSWSSNKLHVGNNWRTKQSDVLRHNARIPEAPAQSYQSVLTYSPPIHNFAGDVDTVPKVITKSDIVMGRNFDNTRHRLLSTPPKPKMYPVFGGRRRRRRCSNSKLDDFELKLERIHLREQLRTRQKLYGKIEKLYETRGLNGSACVMRALCETEQQQKQHNDETEPQSFITELLRAIFTLPRISTNSADRSVKFKEPPLHPTDLHIVDRTYREAQELSGSCAQFFTTCGHSIWM